MCPPNTDFSQSDRVWVKKSTPSLASWLSSSTCAKGVTISALITDWCNRELPYSLHGEPKEFWDSYPEPSLAASQPFLFRWFLLEQMHSYMYFTKKSYQMDNQSVSINISSFHLLCRLCAIKWYMSHLNSQSQDIGIQFHIFCPKCKCPSKCVSSFLVVSNGYSVASHKAQGQCIYMWGSGNAIVYTYTCTY